MERPAAAVCAGPTEKKRTFFVLDDEAAFVGVKLLAQLAQKVSNALRPAEQHHLSLVFKVALEPHLSLHNKQTNNRRNYFFALKKCKIELWL